MITIIFKRKDTNKISLANVSIAINIMLLVRKLTHRNCSFQYHRGHRNDNRSDPFADDETIHLDPNTVRHNIRTEDALDVKYYQDHPYACAGPTVL